MKKAKYFIVSVTAVILALVLVLPQSSVFAETRLNDWAEDIPALLSAGDYIEGEVVAGVVTYGKAITGDQLLAESEEILDVTEEESGDEEFSILYIQREDMTTEQILNRLASNRKVLFAEPNYVIATEDYSPTEVYPSTEEYIGIESYLNTESDPTTESNPTTEENIGTDSTPTTEDSLGTVSAPEPEDFFTADFSQATESDTAPLLNAASIRTEEIPDLTGLQWAYWDEASNHIEGNDNCSMHVPNFGATGSNMENEVIVAVVDCEIDYRHPDLANVLYRFTPEEQAALGCGEWGYNATSQSTDGIPVHYDGNAHGTHCGGIIGAAWDGKGISGAASNVKIVSIQNSTDDGKTSIVNCLRGFDFIDRARSYGIDISITSNSYGLYQGSRALDAAVEKLGEKWGIVSFFAAGNDDREITCIGETGGMFLDNPYAINVASVDSDGSRSGFSNFGQGIVELGAPGGSILSSVSLETSEYLADATPSSNKYYEGFENDGTAVSIVQTDLNGEALSSSTEVTEQSHFAGAHSLKLDLDPNYDLPVLDSAYSRLMLGMSFGNVEELGVQPGDLFGFAIGGAGSFFVMGTYYLNSQTGEINRIEKYGDGGTYGSGWSNVYYEIPESIDLKDFKLIVSMDISNTLNTVYLDSFGFGTEKVPYAIYSGTSMSTPAAAGAAAVLKSQYPDVDGEDFVSLVKTYVTPEESLEDITNTGGRIDFLAASDEAEAPSISEVDVSGTTVTIRGSGFSDQGAVALTKEVAGKDPEEKKASCSSWSDTEVVLTLEEEFKGILQIVLENSAQKQDTWKQFISKSDNIYETDLPFDKGTGQPFVFDAGGDWETKGPLVGLSEKLYYLPAVTKTEMIPAYQKLLCYDISSQTWSEAAPLPEYLTSVSAVGFNGKIAVKGTSMDLLPDGSPTDAQNAKTLVYVYDPASDSWSQGSSDGVLKMDTLAVKGETLILAGKDNKADDIETIRSYDLSTGAGAEIAEIEYSYGMPQVVCKDDIIYVFDEKSYSFIRIQNGKEEFLEDALPEYLSYGELVIPEELEQTERDGVLLAAPEGILFVGPTAADGSGDTYILRDGSDRFEPYKKRMSDSKVSFAAATVYNGTLYAIGTAVYEESGRIFRATQLSKPQSGWVQDEKGWHYYENGVLVKSAWVQDQGKRYYMDASGTMLTGWQQISGSTYYLGDDGAMRTGWQKIGGSTYYFGDDGVMRTGRQQIGGNWYNFGNDGKLQTDQKNNGPKSDKTGQT